MAAAQAHQRASVHCLNNPDAKPPNIDGFFFSVVSMEMILLSVEQSLRLLLLLHYGIIRDDTNHAPRVLYKAMMNKSGGTDGIRTDIVAELVPDPDRGAEMHISIHTTTPIPIRTAP